jgi:hypothetical protein
MVVYDPIVVPSYSFAASPVVYETYRPIVSAPFVTRYRPGLSYVAPVTAYRPVTVYDPLVGDVPVASYRPVITYNAPAVYDPFVTEYYAPVVVRPKVFVTGQPVRNLFRAVTP